jgi:multidrug transporter EmrE-like cation transporter
MIQGYIILAVAILNTVLSQLLFKKGILQIGDIHFSVSNIGLMMTNVFRNPYLLTGMFFYGVSFILWLFVLAKMKLSVAYPITSLNFVLVIVASFYLFGEKLSLLQYASIGLIIIGVVFLAK